MNIVGYENFQITSTLCESAIKYSYFRTKGFQRISTTLYWNRNSLIANSGNIKIVIYLPFLLGPLSFSLESFPPSTSFYIFCKIFSVNNIFRLHLYISVGVSGIKLGMGPNPAYGISWLRFGFFCSQFHSLILDPPCKFFFLFVYKYINIKLRQS